MGVNSLPKTVTRQRRDCDLNPGLSAPESSTLTTRLPSHRQNTNTANWTGFCTNPTCNAYLQTRCISWHSCASAFQCAALQREKPLPGMSFQLLPHGNSAETPSRTYTHLFTSSAHTCQRMQHSYSCQSVTSVSQLYYWCTTLLHLFNSRFRGTTWVSRYKKRKPV